MGMIDRPSHSPFPSVFMARELGTAACDNRNSNVYSVYCICTIMNFPFEPILLSCEHVGSITECHSTDH